MFLFHVHVHVDALVLYLQKVGEAAPNTPMYYYHIPDMTGVRLSMTELVERASTDIPTLRGLKYTDKHLMQLSRIAECERGNYNLMYGSDEVRNTPFLFNVQIINGLTVPYMHIISQRNPSIHPKLMFIPKKYVLGSCYTCTCISLM